nr:MAG TPA: hypothetical protein [Caudoviricetes sp.]
MVGCQHASVRPIIHSVTLRLVTFFPIKPATQTILLYGARYVTSEWSFLPLLTFLYVIL